MQASSSSLECLCRQQKHHLSIFSFSPMKKFLHTFVFFVGFAVLFYIVALLLAPQSLKKNLLYTRGGNGHLYSRIQELRTKKPVEILFLGSSHAYRGFDTRIFDAAGLKSFNLGSSAQSPMQTYVLASKYLSTLKPRLVVYEVNPGVSAIHCVHRLAVTRPV